MKVGGCFSFWLLLREQMNWNWNRGHTRRMGASAGRVRAAVLAVAWCGSEAAFLAVSSAPKIVNTFRPSPTTSPMLPASRGGTRAVRIGLPHMVEVSGEKVKHEFSVFIEDTDCYGVVYNSNYLKFFDRARQAALGVAPLAARQRDGEVLRLLENTEMKLSGSAVLGQEIEVLSSFAPSASDAAVTDWQQTLACKKTGAVLASSMASTFLQSRGSTSSPPLASRLLPGPAPKYTCEYMVWLDEIDGRQQLSDVSILKMFERNRNTALGGPTRLSRLQEEGCLIVVTHINDLKVDISQTVDPGTKLQVQSTCANRKFKFTFEQEIIQPGRTTPLAQAQVTCFSIASDTKKPTSPPLWVLEELGLVPA